LALACFGLGCFAVFVQLGFFFLAQALERRTQIESFAFLAETAAARKPGPFIRILLGPLTALRAPMPGIRFPCSTKQHRLDPPVITVRGVVTLSDANFICDVRFKVR
jgi:hypothetical protein